MTDSRASSAMRSRGISLISRGGSVTTDSRASSTMRSHRYIGIGISLVIQCRLLDYPIVPPFVQVTIIFLFPTIKCNRGSNPASL